MSSKPFSSALRFFPLVLFIGLLWLLPKPALAGWPAISQDPRAAQAPEEPDTPDAPVQVEFLSQLGGLTYATAVSGSYAFVGVGPRLVILNVSDPTNPTFVGQTGVLSGAVRDITVLGSYAYLAVGSGGLRIINCANLSSPSEIGFYNTTGMTYGVAVSGSYAYLADGGSGLRVVSVSNPVSPSEVGSIDTAGYANDVAVSGTRAYVADGTAGLSIIDVSSPGKPSLLSSLDTPGNASGVAVSGDYAFIADWQEGLRVIQINVPLSPKEVGSLPTPGAASGVAVSGSNAFVADYYNGVRVINVSSPALPVETTYFDTAGFAYNVAVSGVYAYVADLSKGMRLINWTASPTPVESSFFDVSSGGNGVTVSGNYAYVADGLEGLQIVNMLNPAAPVEVSYANTPGNAFNSAISGNYAYVADWGSGLRIINKTNPAAPSEIGYIDTPGNAYDVAVSGTYAYVADWGSGLRIIDVSTPSAPTDAGSFDTQGYAGGVVVSGNHAYLADDTYGLRVIQKSNPAAPFEVGFADTAGVAYDVAVSGNYAYVADGSNGLRIISVPSYFSGLNEKEDNDSLATANGQIYSGQTYQGNPDDANDYFDFITTVNGTISINLAMPSGPASQLHLYYNSGGTPVASDTAAPFQINYVGNAGTYTIRIYTSSGFNPSLVYSLIASYPTALGELGGYNTAGLAQAVKVTSGYAYVADGGDGLRVINTSVPASPSEAGSYDTPGSAYDVAVSGNYAYVADGDCGLIILRMCTEPTVPVLTAPANGSTTSTVNTPTFDWNTSSSASEYQIQIDDNSNFSSPAASLTVTTTMYTPSTPLGNATYYWRVRAHNTTSGCDVYSTYSSSWTVTVAVPPTAFGKTTPANGILGVNPDLIPLSWGPSTWATSYQLCLDTSNDNACASWIDVGTATSMYYEGNMNYATMYFFQVRACNTICTEANGGTWWYFITNDEYEPDNTNAQATLVQPGTTRHSITPNGDVDWIRFSLAEEMAVFLQTSGSEGSDSFLSLYTAGLGLIESNDDWGNDHFSYIDRACNVDPLPAGTYYVKVEEKSNNREIPIYNLRVNTWGCEYFVPLVMREPIFYFESPFESEDNDSTAQANGPLRSGREIQGNPDDENDYFSIITRIRGTISVELNDHTGTGVQLLVYYQSAGNTVAVDNTAPYELSFSGEPGTYFVRIYTASGYNSATPYSLTVTYP